MNGKFYINLNFKNNRNSWLNYAPTKPRKFTLTYSYWLMCSYFETYQPISMSVSPRHGQILILLVHSSDACKRKCCQNSQLSQLADDHAGHNSLEDEMMGIRGVNTTSSATVWSACFFLHTLHLCVPCNYQNKEKLLLVQLKNKRPTSCHCIRVAGWSRASACNTDATPTQPHRNSNTHRTKNNTTDVVIQQNSRKLLMMDILMPETC